MRGALAWGARGSLEDPAVLSSAVRALALLLVMLAPVVAAGVPFAMDVADARGDVKQLYGEPLDAPSADIVALRSTHANGTIRHEVEMAAPPTPPYDSMLVVVWFRDSENGSYWTVDLEVRGDAVQPEDRFHALVHRETLENATPIDGARYAVHDRTWIFSYDEGVVADATCFDPGAFSTWERRRVSGTDEAYDATRHCRQAYRTPRAPPPPPAIVVRHEEPRVATPAPGSEATPAPSLVGVVLALALASVLSSWRRRGAS